MGPQALRGVAGGGASRRRAAGERGPARAARSDRAIRALRDRRARVPRPAAGPTGPGRALGGGARVAPAAGPGAHRNAMGEGLTTRRVSPGRAMSIPDETPAAVTTLPSSTTRSATGVAPKAESASRQIQWLVARLPAGQS